MSKNNFEIITLKKDNIEDFAFERNRLLKKAKADWVFFLDSDEKADKTFFNELNRKINDQINGRNSYYIYRDNYFLGRFIGRDKLIRVMRAGSGTWKRSVHEVFVPKPHLAGVVNRSIVHDTARSLFEYINKINRYASMHAIANKEEGKTSNLVKIILFPKLKFIQSLISGRGTVFSILQAFHSFLSWSELWLMQKD